MGKYKHEGHSEYNLTISLIELVHTLTMFKTNASTGDSA